MDELFTHVRFLDGTTYDDFMRYIKRKRVHEFDADIETFKYNTCMQNIRPTLMKSRMFSFCVSFYEKEGEPIYTVLFPSFSYFLRVIRKHASSSVSNRIRRKRIKLNIQNGNKFDNHFIAKEIYDNFHAKAYNLDSDKSKLTVRTARKNRLGSEENYLIENRVKGMSHCSFEGVIDGVEITTVDTLLKIGCSLDTVGKMLLAAGLATEDQLKTTFDYEKFQFDYDLTDEQALIQAMKFYEELTEKELIYIQNDTILLSLLRMHFDKVFKGFKYSKKTKTQNIIEAYTVNELARYQILGKVKHGKNTYNLNYSEYQVDNENFADIVQRFYKGGLNFYNQKYLGKLLTYLMISFDINSSYPSILYEFKLPYLLEDYGTGKQRRKVKYDMDHVFCMYQITKGTFNKIMRKLTSRVARQMLVKYFRTTDEFVYITSWTFKMLSENFKLHLTEIDCVKWFEFSVRSFGANEVLTDFYFTKTQGKSKTKVEFVDNKPTNIIFTNEPSERVFSKPEIDISKVNLNGIYGAPALRPTYSIGYRDEEDNLKIMRNGWLNTERNAMTSVFTTGGALWRLTQPFKYLTPEEIDDYFVYCDTDSLYMKKECLAKIDKSIFHQANLGSWDIEHEEINKFYVLNHKKYVLQDDDMINTDKQDEKYNPYGISFRCGGIPESAFDINMPFDEFVHTQFSKGCRIPNNKSVFTKERTVVIYRSTTELDLGNEYPEFYKREDDELYQEIIENVRQDLSEADDSDVLYIETHLGALAIKDVFQENRDTENCHSMIDLLDYSNDIDEILSYVG